MDELVAFLRAALDEDLEAAQVAAALTRSPWTAQSPADVIDGDGYAVVRDPSDRPERAIAEHIARWDPARVLAEVQAKRRILDARDEADQDAKRNHNEPGFLAGADAYDNVIRELAQPYAGQPGWREEWRA